MTDAPRVPPQLSRLALVKDEELAGLAAGPVAWDLFAALVAEREPAAERRDRAAEPGPRRDRAGRTLRGLVPAAVAVGAMSVAAVVGLSVLEDRTGRATSYANSAIDVRLEGDVYVARVKDPLADHALYVEAFKAIGKEVDITLVPVSPGRVGSLLEAGGSGSGPVQATTDLVSSGSGSMDCAVTPASCTMVIRISADSTGSVWYRIGRAAQPGEAVHDPDRGPGGSSVGGPSAVGSSGQPATGSGN